MTSCDQTAPRVVGIVLGARVQADGRPSDALRRRALWGATLFLSGRVEHLILSGGAIGQARAEADAMAELVLAEGVPESAVTRESCARNTRENARFSVLLARQLTRGAVNRLLVISDGYHVPRARMMVRRQVRGLSISVQGSAAPGPEGQSLMRWLAIVREGVAFLRDAVRPNITEP